MTARTRPAALLVAAILAATLALAAPAAHAGTYTVTGTTSAWTPFNTNAARIAVYPEGTHLIARNVGGNFSTPRNDTGGGWRFDPPPGTAIRYIRMSANVTGGAAWSSRISVAAQGGGIIADCTGAPTCSDRAHDREIYNATSPIVATVRCVDSGGCPNAGTSPRADLDIGASLITLYDPSSPGVGIIGGSVTGGGWHGGTGTLNVSGDDNSGVSFAGAAIDGDLSGSRGAKQLGCDYALKVPCSNQRNVEIPVDLRGLPDGQHALAGLARDAAGNAGTSTQQTVNVDNTPPGPPAGAQLADGPGWRSANTFSVAWSNPAQQFAPIAGANYRLCPYPAGFDSPACVNGHADGAGIAALSGIQVPHPGAWRMRLFLYDAAANSAFDNGVTIEGLGFDPTPPTGLQIHAMNPADPARVVVAASDPESGLAGGRVELRRRHTKAWRPVKTRLTPGGLTAVLPDGRLKRGRYAVRARVQNHAGLTALTRRRSNGHRASVKLPVRVSSRLTAGRPRHGHLQRNVRVKAGKKVRIRGHLTARHKQRRKGLRGRRVRVLQRVSVQGRHYHKIASIRTGRHGRIRYRAKRGPARRIRFVYAGSRHVQGARGTVDLRVRAHLGLRVDHRHVRNGETVNLAGKLRGGKIPPGGALLELQVYSRGRWRPFATPRTDAKGRYRFPYRFETVLGTAKFRFRAVLRKQPTYPYIGVSHPVKVRVNGL